MAETSAIEWTDSTFNPWIGCTKISPACDHCYAEALMDTRHHRVKWGGERVRTSEGNWKHPRAWQRQAAEFIAAHGRRRRVFCASLADVFDNQVPPQWRDDLWQLIRQTPDLDWQLLTKRPQNIAKMLPAFWDEVKGHVWLGTTVEDQSRADQNIPRLLQHDAAVRFISCEPLLGPIDLMRIAVPQPARIYGFETCDALRGSHYGEDFLYQPPHIAPGPLRLNWVIAGGESGPEARPPNPAWFRSLRDQCAAAGVPFLFKQWGQWAPGEFVTKPDGLWFHMSTGPTIIPGNRSWPALHFFEQSDANRLEGPGMAPIGKAKAGRLLDGVEHNGFPS